MDSQYDVVISCSFYAYLCVCVLLALKHLLLQLWVVQVMPGSHPQLSSFCIYKRLQY